MKSHYCKVGKIKPNLNRFISLEEFEKIISYFVEDNSRVEYPKNISA